MASIPYSKFERVVGGTQSGKDAGFYNDFKFVFHKTLKSGEGRWVCSGRSKHSCRSYLILRTDGEVVYTREGHTHDTEWDIRQVRLTAAGNERKAAENISTTRSRKVMAEIPAQPGNSQTPEPRVFRPPGELEIPFQLPKKLKYIEPQARILLANVLHFFEEEAKIQDFVVNPWQAKMRTVSATGVGLGTICSITKELRANPNGKKFTQMLHRKTKDRSWALSEKSNPEFYDMERLREFLFDIILNAQQMSTKTAYQSLKKTGLYSGSSHTLSRLFKKMGFSFKRARGFSGPRSALTEDHHMRFGRFSFLRNLLNFQKDGQTKTHRYIVYVSVVMFPTLRCKKRKIDDDDVDDDDFYTDPVKLEPADGDWKGVIGLAGDRHSLLEGGFSFWRCSREPGNYLHDYDACYKDYVSWIVDRVLPSCPDQAVIVLDHDPKYFDRTTDPPPTHLSSKDDMKSWLSRNGVPHDENAAKVELHGLIRQIGKTLVKSSVKSIIEQKRLTVLPLPPYHWELSPASLIIREIRSKTIDQKLHKFSDVAEFVESQVQAVTSTGRWKNASSKCWALSETYFALHPTLEERQDFLVKKSKGLIDPDDDASESEGDWLHGDDEGGRPSDEDSHEAPKKLAKSEKPPKRAFLVGDDLDLLTTKKIQ